MYCAGLLLALLLSTAPVTCCVPCCCCCCCCQVVVDSHESAKALLDRGQLTKRVTIIPLNQVRQRFVQR